VIFAFQTIAATAPKAENVADEIERSFRFYGLTWPACVDGLDYRFVADLQGEISEDAVLESSDSHS